MKHACAIVLLFSLLLMGHTQATAADNTGYVAAELIHKQQLRYPRHELERGREGWVRLSWVVDTDGSVTDVVVDDSSGQKYLEKAAIRTVKAYKYKPAMQNGVPIQQGNNRMLMSFHIERNSNNAAKPDFAAAYKKGRRLIDKGKLKEAEKVITRLQNRKKWNLYEDAHFWLLKSVYLLSAGQQTEAMDTLAKATFYDKAKLGPSVRPYLPKKAYIAAMMQLYLLQVQHQLYRDALNTYKKLKTSYPNTKQLQKMQKSADKIIALSRQDSLLQIDGNTSAQGFWKYQPLRRAFSLADINGKLDKLVISCSRKVFNVDAEPNRLWRIPESVGECTICIYGDADTAFKLYEHPAKKP